MNTKTAPEANTGRIVSKFWPSSLFIFVNSSWWFFPLLWSPHHVREYEKSKLTFYWNNTWRIHDNKETCLSPSLSAACGNQRWRTEWLEWLRHQRYVTVLFNAPPVLQRISCLWLWGKLFCRDTVGSPEWARWPHLARLGFTVQDLAHIARSSSHHYYNEYYCWLLLLSPVKFAAWIN